MFATFIIGLREGLEAALIVSIIATFLKRNNQSLRPMWFGVVAATVLSILVGVGLNVTAMSLPQAQQEALETVIGAVAMIFVTSMILWMDAHSKDIKKNLEDEAATALNTGRSWALAGMAFLAVLKEGFETSVFLLATIQASGTSALAMIGATIGILIAIALGIGMYFGGVRINLSKFFRITGVFLVLVAAGLVMSTLRTAHEAGWLNAGQQTTVNLSWLVPNGSFSSAVITGIFGIPADPRLIEAVGWGTYLIAVLAYLFWPRTYRQAHPKRVAGIFAGTFTLAAIALAMFAPIPSAPAVTPLAVAATTNGSTTSLHASAKMVGNSLVLHTGNTTTTLAAAGDEVIDGLATRRYTARTAPKTTQATLTLNAVAALNGGRLPVGIDISRSPGPFKTTLVSRQTTTANIAQSQLLNVASSDHTVATLTGGGLPTNKTLTLSNPSAVTVHTANAVTAAHVNTVRQYQTLQREATLWRVTLPIAYLLVAITIFGSSLLRQRHVAYQRRKSARRAPATHMPPVPVAASPTHR